MWIVLALLSSLAQAAPSFPLEMEMEFCYEGEPCGDTVWTFFADGTFESSSSEGRWEVRGRLFRIVYVTGSEYRGTLDPASRCITGDNRRASGERGTFEACVR